MAGTATWLSVARPTDRRTEAISLRARPWCMRARAYAIGRSGRGKFYPGSNGCVCVTAAADWPSTEDAMLKRTISHRR